MAAWFGIPRKAAGPVAAATTVLPGWTATVELDLAGLPRILRVRR